MAAYGELFMATVIALAADPAASTSLRKLTGLPGRDCALATGACC